MKVQIMFNVKELIRYMLLIPILFLLVFSPAVQTAEGSSSIDYEVPIYKINMSEDTQRNIWKMCEESHLSYELVLAIHQIEDSNATQIDNVKAEIKNLAYLRNYWTEQGFPDEIVFDLMLLSRQKEIEGCRIYMKNNDSYYLDDYVQKVTEYKYYIEQSLNEVLVSNPV